VAGESEQEGRYRVQVRADLALGQIRADVAQLPGVALTDGGAAAPLPPPTTSGGPPVAPATPAVQPVLRILPLEPGASGTPPWAHACTRELRAGLRDGHVRVDKGADATLRLREDQASAQPFRPGTVVGAQMAQVKLRLWLDAGRGHVEERTALGLGLALDATSAQREALCDAARMAGEQAAAVLNPGGAVASPGAAAAPRQGDAADAGAAVPAGRRVVQLDGLRPLRLPAVVKALQAELPGELVQLRVGARLEVELTASAGQAARVQAALQRVAGVPVQVVTVNAQRLVARWPEGAP
jgi:hypothetical protein